MKYEILFTVIVIDMQLQNAQMCYLMNLHMKLLVQIFNITHFATYGLQIKKQTLNITLTLTRKQLLQNLTGALRFIKVKNKNVPFT